MLWTATYREGTDLPEYDHEVDAASVYALEDGQLPPLYRSVAATRHQEAKRRSQQQALLNLIASNPDEYDSDVDVDEIIDEDEAARVPDAVAAVVAQMIRTVAPLSEAEEVACYAVDAIVDKTIELTYEFDSEQVRKGFWACTRACVSLPWPTPLCNSPARSPTTSWTCSSTVRPTHTPGAATPVGLLTRRTSERCSSTRCRCRWRPCAPKRMLCRPSTAAQGRVLTTSPHRFGGRRRWRGPPRRLWRLQRPRHLLERRLYPCLERPSLKRRRRLLCLQRHKPSQKRNKLVNGSQR